MTAEPGRNAPCTCGSGKKYKNCCGSKRPRKGDRSRVAPATPLPAVDDSLPISGTLLAVLVAAIVALLLYSNVYRAPFMFDDLPYVRENTLIRDPGNLLKVWRTSYPPGHEAQGLYRPVTATSYIADFVFWKLDATKYHLTNIILHAVAVALFVWLLTALGLSAAAAAAGGLLFAAHSVHTEAVSWIVGRAEILAGIFTFAAVLAWIQWRRTGLARFVALTVALYFLGLGAKETAAPLPAALLLGDWLGIFKPAGTREPRASAGFSPLRQPHLTAYLALGASFIIYVILRLSALGHFAMIEEGKVLYGQSFTTRLFTALAVVGKYLQLTLLPVQLHVDYAGFIFQNPFHPLVLLGLATLGGLVWAAFHFRARAPLVAFWCGWFILFILVFSHLLMPIGAFVAERFVYIASAAACALGGMVIGRFTTRGRSEGARNLAWMALGAVLLFLAVVTVARNRDWKDPIRFYRAEIEHSPKSEKAHINLAMILWDQGRNTGDQPMMDESDQLLRQAIGLREASSSTMTGDHANLLYLYANHLRERHRATQAIPVYERLIKLFTQYPVIKGTMSPDIFVWYGVSLEDLNRTDEARAQYEQALKERPGWPGPLMNLGNILRKQGKIEEAIAFYRQAVKSDPYLNFGYMNLGYLYAELKKNGEAEEIYRTFTSKVPNTPESAYYKGLLAQRLGKRDEAIEHYRASLALNPRYPDSKKALADLTGKPE